MNGNIFHTSLFWVVLVLSLIYHDSYFLFCRAVLCCSWLICSPSSSSARGVPKWVAGGVEGGIWVKKQQLHFASVPELTAGAEVCHRDPVLVAGDAVCWGGWRGGLSGAGNSAVSLVLL